MRILSQTPMGLKLLQESAGAWSGEDTIREIAWFAGYWTGWSPKQKGSALALHGSYRVTMPKPLG